MTTDDATPTPDELISRPDAGRLLGLSAKGVDGLIKRGELRAWRVGTRVKLAAAEVNAYLSTAQIRP
ncbi:excisionase family DNA-binding protein [Mycobacterium sp. 155]|uniref:excisionase family DNA-binding protein n=1 Tax=Mycobacterium sp. 155 TaxID=1157943 RepID=UPI00036FF3FB|nr:excisionase family DNA-binding protein [Mycobacterium sp. 155]